MNGAIKKIFAVVLTAGLGLVSTVSGAAADKPLTDVSEIVNKANLAAYYQGDDGKAKVKMVITGKSGQTREREFVILRKDVADGGDQNYFVYFDKPADVRGMVYMVHKHAALNKDDDRWLYLPALSLVKRIAAGDKRTSFVGSDFLYEDVSGRSFEEDTHKLVKTTDTRYIVKNEPKNPDSVEFSYFTVEIDRKTFIPRKMDFFDKAGKLYRTIDTGEPEMIQGFPTVTRSVATDLKAGTKTEMQFSEVKYNIHLGNIFQERYLHRPPREALR